MSVEPLTAEEYADILYGRAVSPPPPSSRMPSTTSPSSRAPEEATLPSRKRSMDGATFKFLLVAAGVLVAELVLALVVVRDSARKNEARARGRAYADLGVGAAGAPDDGGADEGQRRHDRKRQRRQSPSPPPPPQTRRTLGNSIIVEPYEAERPDGYAFIYQNGTYAVL